MQFERIQEALRQESIDAWLFFDHHVRDPLAYRVLGFECPRTPTRRWYYLIPSEGEPRKLVHRIESHMLDALPGNTSSYAGWSTQVAGLRNLLGNARCVAMQYSPNCAVPYVSMVDGGTIELIRGLGVEVVSSANLIQEFEARWTAEQLETHLDAGRLVDAIRAQAFLRIAELQSRNTDVGEFDIQSFIRQAFDREGLVTDHGPIVAVNANMSDPHYEPSADRSASIRRGDAVLIDMWAKRNLPHAVFYDITWTGFCAAEAPSALTRVFEIVSGARDCAISRVRNAVARKETLFGYQVDDAARDYIAEAGYSEHFVHRTGHSIGEEVHGTGANMDNLETHDERRVISRTCFSIEPGIYLPDFGVRSEVNVYVGEHEARVTGETQGKLVSIV